MLAFSIDYYGIFFGATQSVELFCTYDILKKYRNLEQKKDWKNQKLLGNDLKFSARDLINVYVELEKEFDIHFKEKDIVAGKFDTFDDIIKLINKEIAYKTRGKEHA